MMPAVRSRSSSSMTRNASRERLMRFVRVHPLRTYPDLSFSDAILRLTCVASATGNRY